MKLGYVYWVHLPNQQIKTEGYVGVSINPQKRWEQHKTQKSSKHLSNAITKYGEQLIWDVIFFGPLEGCYQLEEYFRPTPTIGWNIAIGGENSGNLGRPLSIQTKLKLSNSRKGITPWNKGKTNIYSEATLQKLQSATKARVQGSNNPMFGKTHSDQTKLLLSKLHKGKTGQCGKDNPSAIAVICNETGLKFDTIQAAATSIGCTIQALSMHLKGKTKTCKTYTWNYL